MVQSLTTSLINDYMTFRLNESLFSWWRHQMEAFFALLAFCAVNSPVTGEFPAQRPVTRSFNVFFDLRLNQQMRKQWRGLWFETTSRSLWCHFNDNNSVISGRGDQFNVVFVSENQATTNSTFDSSFKYLVEADQQKNKALFLDLDIFTVAKIRFTTDGEKLYIWELGLILKPAIFTHP